MRAAPLALALLVGAVGCSVEYSEEPAPWRPGPASVWVSSIPDGAATGHRLLTVDGDFDIPGLFSECGGEVFVTNEATGSRGIAVVDKEYETNLWGEDSCVRVLGWSRLVMLVLGENRLLVEVRSDEAYGSTRLTVFLREDLLGPRILVDSPYRPTTTAEPVAPVLGRSWDALRVDWANRTTGEGGSATVEPAAEPRDPWAFDTWSADVPLACGPNVIELTATSPAGNISSAAVSNPVERQCP